MSNCFGIVFGLAFECFGIDAVLLEVLVFVQLAGVRDVGRGQLAGVELAEVDFLEPRVTLQLLSTRLLAAEPLGRVSSEQAQDDVLALGREPARPGDLEGQDLLEEPLLLGRDEGRDANRHLVDEAAERPEVDLLGVALAQDDLGREVLGRAHLLHVVDLRAELALRQPEVSQLALPVAVDHQVLRLQVPVQDLVLVQLLQHQHHLRRLELGAQLRQFLIRLDVLEDFAAFAEVHYHL